MKILQIILSLLLTFDIAFANPNNTLALIVSSNGGGNWNIPVLLPNLPNPIHINDVSCSGDVNQGVCLAAGFIGTTYTQPRLLKSLDGGKNWMKQKTISGINQYGILLKTTCIGSGSLAKCYAVGIQNKANDAYLLIQSMDGGKTWESQSVPELNAFKMHDISCTGNNENVFCVALASSASQEMIIQTQNNGHDWSIATMPKINSLLTNLNHVSCSGSPNNATCVVIGKGQKKEDSHLHPIILQTTDSGKTWEKMKVDGCKGLNCSLNHIYCSGDAKQTFCVAAGSQESNALIVSSKGHLHHWKTVTFSEASDVTMLKCVGDKIKNFCFAELPSQDKTVYTLLKTIDAGESWSISSRSNTSFPAISCVPRNTKTLCFATGKRLISTLDEGKNWYPVVTPNTNQPYLLKNISCSGSGDFAICAAGGGGK